MARSGNAKRWQRAIANALDRKSRVEGIEALDALADKLIQMCEMGELSALKELGDRLDGKSLQQTELSGPDGTDLFTGIKVKFVKPDSK